MRSSKSQTLHVISPEKFILPYISFLNERFAPTDHKLYLFGNKTFYQSDHKFKAIYHEDYRHHLGYLALAREMRNASKVILHGLFNDRLTQLLFLNPQVLKKCFWVIWGGDLYRYRSKEKRIKFHIDEFIRRCTISRIGNLVTYVPGDVELARKWYGATGTYHHCILYPSNVPAVPHELEISDRHTEEVRVLIGNSADPENHHAEVIDRIATLHSVPFRAFAPLSYGDTSYASLIADYGTSKLADRFVPLREFMSLEQYRNFLKSIDIAIFNHGRQQGMGNILSLLAAGKKVYMRSDISSANMLQSLGIKVFDIRDLSLARLSRDEAESNASIVRSLFTSVSLAAQWNSIFEY